MNPEIVWHTWRRIMREPALQQAVFKAPAADGAGLERFGLDGEARAAALAYGAQAEQAQWFVVNYRYRLANSFLNALETGAPMVLRALLAKGLELRELGEQFLDQHGWKDYGPRVYGYCRDALRFLSEHPATAAPEGLRDLIGLERTGVELLLSLADGGAATAPAPAILARTPWAACYRSEARLSAWMRDKKQLGKGDLAAGVEHYLVYLPDPAQALKFALLPPRALEIYQALQHPIKLAALPGALAALGHAEQTGQDQACLKALTGYRAVHAGWEG
ncbi:hypothetical protein HSX11_10470 [Oxalobacteraceae bacterium]|nr:hypothetical protein [Oxalobacteraceae bacterium]